MAGLTMKEWQCIIFFLALFMIQAAGAFASGFSLQITHVDSSAFPEIDALIRVYKDTPFELVPEDLAVYEKDRQIATFTLQPQQFKHYISLVIDRSSSIENAMLKVKKAAAGFVKSLIGEVSFSIISFGSDIDFNHDFSRDADSLIEAIKKIRPWGGTLLYDAIFDACEDLQGKAGLNDLKTVLCITDGKDSTPSGQTQLSMRNADEVVRYAVDKSIRVVTIGLGEEIDPEFLARIASATGGWYLQAATADQLVELCKTMSDRIKRRRHYLVRFKTCDIQLTSNARPVKIQIRNDADNSAASRSYHPPNSVKAAPDDGAEITERIFPLNDLFEALDISMEDRRLLTENIRIPHPEPVYGLTLASFERAGTADSRILINKAREDTAKQHQQNFTNQQKFVKQYMQKLDRLLQNMFKLTDASGLSNLKHAHVNSFIRFLQLRRQELELLNQQAYEMYLVSLKASIDELDYFDRTQVLGQPTNEKFFDTNASVKANAVAAVKKKHTELIEKIRAQINEYNTGHSESKPAPRAEKPRKTQEPGIKRID